MAGADPVDDQPARSKQRTVTALLKEVAFVVIGALVVSSLLRAFVGQMFVIPSGSMGTPC